MNTLRKQLMAATGAALIALGVGEASQAATFQVLARGLDSPRGLTFGPDGALYVTEAGKGGTGPCIPSPNQPGANQCYGPTSAVTQIQNSKQERVITGLPSLALPDGSDATGAQDIEFDSTGKAYVVVGLGADPASRDNTLGITDFGQLITIDDELNGGASWTKLADLAAYEGSNNPDGTEIDSNPYALLVQNETAFVADAGANDLLRVETDTGKITTESAFDARSVPSPFPGPAIPMQSVPTAVELGPDDALYVGELTGFPFPKNGARIYRIGPDKKPEVYADGFTNIIDLAFGPKGDLYILEYAANSLLSNDPTGALIRVAPDGTRTTIASDGLVSPTGLALDAEGAIYVSNRGFKAGEGQVVLVPEPSSTLGTLAFGVIGAVYLMKQRMKKQKTITPGENAVSG